MSNQSDPFFTVEVLRQTLDPQQLVYLAMHQDYSEDFVINELGKIPDESKCGEIIVNRLLAGERGHYGCLEHPQISFACGYFPHSVMQQARTHRVSVSFDVQSGRYTGQRILTIAKKFPPLNPFYSVEGALIDNPGLITEIEKLFYLRPVGFYTDRKGNKYDYNEDIRYSHILRLGEAVLNYADDIEAGLSEEHARGLIPFDFRQHFVVSFNARSLMHFLDLRHKKDAQLEIQILSEMLWQKFKNWMPQVATYYEDKRLNKARLAP